MQDALRAFQVFDTSARGVVSLRLFFDTLGTLAPISSPTEILSLLLASEACNVSYTEFLTWLFEEQRMAKGRHSEIEIIARKVFCDSTSQCIAERRQDLDSIQSLQQGRVPETNSVQTPFRDSAELTNCMSLDVNDQRLTDHKSSEHLGVSVHYLKAALIEEVRAVGHPEGVSVHEIEPTVIRPKGREFVCPRDGRLGSAYVDCLHGAENVGRAKLMLSYAWSYSIDEICQTLANFCMVRGLERSAAYVWMCCLCVNQHRVQERRAIGENVSFESFAQAFGDRVHSTECLVAMMSPWDNPTYLTRVWCLYEMYTALTCGDATKSVAIALPPSEIQRLSASLSTEQGIDHVWDTLMRVDVRNATASAREDRDRIIGLIQDGKGFEELNSAVAGCLKRSYLQEAEAIVRRSMHSGNLKGLDAARQCIVVGGFLLQAGRNEEALELQKAGLHELEDFGLAISRLLRIIGVAMGKLGNFDGELGAYEEALLIRKRTNTLETHEGAGLLRSIGEARGQKGDREGQDQAFQAARRIREQTGTMETPQGAHLWMNIGELLGQQGDLDGQVQAYEQAKHIREVTHTLESPFGARLLELIIENQRLRGIEVAHAEQLDQIRKRLSI